MSRVDSLESFVYKSIRNYMKDVHTCLPGIVDTFDPETQTLSIQLAISRIFKNAEGEQETLELPTLINVPLLLPQANGFSLTLPISPGDECLVIFSERSIDNWLKQGGVQPPNDIRFHDLSDGFAILGINNETKVISDYDTENMVLRNQDDSCKITIKPQDEIELKTPTRITVDTPELYCTGEILAEGNIKSNEDVIDRTDSLDNLRTNYNEHKHIGNLGSPTSLTDKPDP